MRADEVRAMIRSIIERNRQACERFLSSKLKEFRKFYGTNVLNPWKLLMYRNIQLFRADLSAYNVRGFFKISTDRRPQIYYDGKLKNPELRYTIMHEIAHELLMEYVKEHLPDNVKESLSNVVYDQVVDSKIMSNRADVIEKLCDDFAMEALMPMDMCNQLRAKYGGNINDERLAEYFGLEKELIRSRLETGR